MKLISFLTFLCCFCVIFEAYGQREYPPHIGGAKEFTYKTVSEIKLNLWIIEPKNHKLIDNAPAIVFFFGGGFNHGNPAQFVKHCEYLSRRGMVAIVADYRVRSRHDITLTDCVSDAKSAIRWVRKNALELGVDSSRIAAGGASSGGLLAVACATLPKFDEENENKTISSKPSALVLFNPAMLGPFDDSKDLTIEENNEREKRLGTKPVNLRPFHNIVYKQPSTIIFHGTGDKVVSFMTVELFTKRMHEFGNKCILIGYEGESHRFFNYGNKSNALFIDTMYKMDEFLVSLGYLLGTPETVVFTN